LDPFLAPNSDPSFENYSVIQRSSWQEPIALAVSRCLDRILVAKQAMTHLGQLDPGTDFFNRELTRREDSCPAKMLPRRGSPLSKQGDISMPTRWEALEDYAA